MTTAEDEQFPAPPPRPSTAGSVDPAASDPEGARPASPRSGEIAARVLRGWGPAIAWMVLIFALSAQPGLRVSDDPGVDGPVRHFAHVLAYAGLAVLLLRGLASRAAAPWSWRRAGVAVLLTTLYGVTDEIHQTYVPQRTGHLIDVGWDLLGAIAAIAALWFVARRWPRLGSIVAGMD